ncbi:MAG: tetratricopeptide repeat protein [Paludibacteraceae bacterium]|nr:tetratricopeptide repeat protein [Paludibacteraceae bacterium]
MKRFIILFSVALVSVMCFAQKANISKAKSFVEAEENPNYDEAKSLIEAALLDESTREQAKTVWTAGYVYEKSAMASASSQDWVNAGLDALKAYDYYVKAYNLDLQPNAKGKVKPVYGKKIQESMMKIYKYGLLVNYSVEMQNNQNWTNAYNTMDKHVSMLDLPLMMVDPKVFANDTSLRKNDTYYGYVYWAGRFAYNGEMYNEVIKQFSKLKGTGYNEQAAYEFIAGAYDNLKDSENYLKTLKEGSTVFPQSEYLINNLIIYYTEKNQKEEAINYLNIAINNNPTPQLYNVLGTIYRNDEIFDKALTYFTKAVELNPDYSNANYNIGEIYYTMGELINEANMKINDQNTLKIKNAERLEKYMMAVPYMEKAYELNNEDADALRVLKMIYYRIKLLNPKYQPKHSIL